MTEPKRRTLAEIAASAATITVSQACADLGISVSHGYALIASGNYPAKVITVGGRRLVLTASLVELLRGGEAA